MNRLMLRALSVPLFLLTLLLSACAPGLGKTIPVTRFPDAPTMIKSTTQVGRVLVRPFSDGRSEATMVEIDGRPVSADSDVGGAVRGAFESYLREAGFKSGTVNVPNVTGNVEKWYAEVHPGFPTSQVQATASVNLAVLGVDGKERFKGTYRGEYSFEHPLMNEDRIAEALGQAMAAAFQEALQDPRFTDPIAMGH